jgi:hypothetical protein
LASHCAPAPKPTLLQNELDFLHIDPGAVEIRLGAVNERVGLEINAKSWSDQKAGQIEIPGRADAREVERIAPVAGAKSEAQIEAEIDATPVIDSRYGRGDLRRRRTCRRWRGWRGKIGRKPLARSGKCQDSGQ